MFTARHTFFAAFHSFSNAKMAEGTTEIEIPAVVRPRPGGTPQRPISYGSPLQRAKKKKTMRSRKRPVTLSLVLDKSLPPPFDRYLDLCFLLVLFFFFPLPLPLHPFHPFSRATVTSSNWHVSQFDAYSSFKEEEGYTAREEARENEKGGKAKEFAPICLISAIENRRNLSPCTDIAPSLLLCELSHVSKARVTFHRGYENVNSHEIRGARGVGEGRGASERKSESEREREREREEKDK